MRQPTVKSNYNGDDVRGGTRRGQRQTRKQLQVKASSTNTWELILLKI